jgi:hypothetical protein
LRLQGRDFETALLLSNRTVILSSISNSASVIADNDNHLHHNLNLHWVTYINYQGCLASIILKVNLLLYSILACMRGGKIRVGGESNKVNTHFSNGRRRSDSIATHLL